MNSLLKNERNYGLDVCRVFAMLGIVLLHVLGRGGVLSAEAGSLDYWIAWFLEIVAYSSVNIFGMLSGYLGYNKKNYSTYRLIDLLVTLFLYSVIITIIFFICDKGVFNGIKDIIKSILPILAGRYWYITCYIIVFLFMPYMNILIDKLNQKQCKTLCIVIFISLSLIPSLINRDLFVTENGYSAIWLLSLYTFGAVYRKLDTKILYKWSWLIVIFCNVLVLFIKIAFYYIFNKDMQYMIDYTSPFMVISSLFIIHFFAKSDIKIKHPKFLLTCSAAAFDVYILHCHILIFDNLIANNFKWILDLPTIAIPIMVVLCAVGIYVFGIITYVIRRVIFRVLKVEKLLKFIAKPFDNLFFYGFLVLEKDNR